VRNVFLVNDISTL